MIESRSKQVLKFQRNMQLQNSIVFHERVKFKSLSAMQSIIVRDLISSYIESWWDTYVRRNTGIIYHLTMRAQVAYRNMGRIYIVYMKPNAKYQIVPIALWRNARECGRRATKEGEKPLSFRGRTKNIARHPANFDEIASAINTHADCTDDMHTTVAKSTVPNAKRP